MFSSMATQPERGTAAMPTQEAQAVLAALRKFADDVTAKTNAPTSGEPEDQLRGPFEVFMREIGRVIGRTVVCTGETRLAGRLGKPDYGIHATDTLAGYAELKAPGTGANPSRFTGRNREQWTRFSAIPNLLYCDGNDWGLYRSGQAVRPVVRLTGDVAAEGKKAVAAKDAAAVLALLTDFLSWQPLIPTTSRGKIDLRELAAMLAPLCRMLREDVVEALQYPQSPLVQLAGDWRQLLFPDASDRQFADSYAQTVTFALLLARSQGADPLLLDSAERALAAEHSLLARALQVLTDPEAQKETSASLNLLVRVIGVVPPVALAGPDDPWLYFYEDFLAVYDPGLRKDIGAYYTPVEVVRAQVRLIDDLLTKRFGRPLGFADRGVITLDPAAGTGTYLLGVIEHALKRIESQQGAGAVPGQATALAANLYGFEVMVGPFAVAELRVSRALQDQGAVLPADGTNVYLTDTLESPNTPPPTLPFYLKPIAQQHARALKVKSEVPVIVCLGNPPYGRHDAADDTNQARTGGWVRWGDRGDGRTAIFQDFVNPALDAGYGVHVKNLYNLYVYFWRWALWKVFEHGNRTGPGVVSFISAASYIEGDAFCGLREHLRRLCDEVWILDLGGEGRGTRQTENVFAIQTPVAIAVCARFGQTDTENPAEVRYARLDGTRADKLQSLDAVTRFASIQWQECPSEWHSPLRPAGAGKYFDWPLLTELLPWQHSGVQFKRTWPIAPEPEVLKRRWRGLLAATNRAAAFKETRDRKVVRSYPPLPGDVERLEPIDGLGRNTSAPRIVRYAYRSFDRHWILADSRLGDFLRPELWAAHADDQVYLTTLLNHPLGNGPAVTASAEIPDLHHFRGSFGSKEIVPLYRNGHGRQPNVQEGLLEALSKAYKQTVTHEDFFAYVYGLLAQPAFTRRFATELATREVRVPLTWNAKLFFEVRDAGAKLLWLHTYGQRYVPKRRHRGHIPKGRARCAKPVPASPAEYPDRFEYVEATKTLHVGQGQFAPVASDVYDFEVSGLKVVQSWLGYRMKHPKGKKSSPLDDIRPESWTSEFTTELLELLWILEATIAEYPRMEKLLAAVASKRMLKF
jgi:hypothetical protein